MTHVVRNRKGEPVGVRTLALMALNVWGFMRCGERSVARRVTTLGVLCRYAALVWPRKRRTAVDVDRLVKAWVDAIVGMSTAHDKDAFDAADYESDELLTPLLAAPVAQIREFYAKLLEAMKADPRVPWIVWIGYEAWGEAAIKGAPDEGVKRLKNQLAQQIADLVEQPIKEQLGKALARALRWRDPETLQEVKAAVEAGGKPKLKGRESCLFLELGRGRGKKKVRVML